MFTHPKYKESKKVVFQMLLLKQHNINIFFIFYLFSIIYFRHRTVIYKHIGGN